jgi:hypothetical protein
MRVRAVGIFSSTPSPEIFDGRLAEHEQIGVLVRDGLGL